MMSTWMQIYESRRSTSEDALRSVQSGARVYLAGNCATPKILLQALIVRAKTLRNVEVIQVLTVSDNAHVRPEMNGHIRVNSLFISGDVREAVQAQRADFTPIFLSEIPALMREELPVDVALIHVSPPDEQGFCSFGVEVGLTRTATDIAPIVIAEVNPQMPRTLGNSFIHVSKLTHIVEVNYPIPEYPAEAPSPVQHAIGQQVATLIEDGSTLQIGIGGIPESVFAFLGDKKQLGMHTELLSDGAIDLVNQGVITNEAKTVHPGKIIAGFLLGTQRLYDFAHNNPIIELHPTDYVNDPFLIAQNRKMVAVNSAIEVDLTGQVCADSIGHKFYSGVGGQVDFIRGAARSKGGKPIIALPSTVKNDMVSRIVWELKPGAGVITTRNDVHYIVTEYGVAYLHGKTIRERVRALIDIAHPKFQAELEDKAIEMGYLSRAHSLP